MNKAKFKLVFNRKNSLNNQGEAPVSIDIYKGGINPVRKFITTQVVIKPEQWDDKRKQVVNHRLDYQYNRLLSEITRSLEDFEFQLLNNKMEITQSNLEAFLSGQGIDNSSFLAFWQSEMSAFTSNQGTKKSHFSAFNVLYEFRPNLKFTDVDYSLITDFDNYLRYEKKLAQNTIAKYHQHVKKYMNLARKKKRTTVENPYQDFKIVRVESDRENLTAEEVVAIERLDLESMPDINLLRDTFMLSCYTGLRFVDVYSLCSEDLKISADEITIVKRMQKVDKTVTLPLKHLFEGKPQKILQKYIKDKGYFFPQHSNQHVNRMLKIIAQMARIKSNLTFHVARHTFGTFLAEKTQNPYLIMDLMGHSKIDTSMIYIHRSQERINKQLRSVNWSLD